VIRGTCYVAGSMNALWVCESRACNLEARGFRVVSTWHGRRDEGKQTFAEIGATDMLEILRATHVVINGDTPSSTGGYAVECGIALALGKDVTVIGEWGENNVFAHVPGVRRYASWSTYLAVLDAEVRSIR